MSSKKLNIGSHALVDLNKIYEFQFRQEKVQVILRQICFSLILG